MRKFLSLLTVSVFFVMLSSLSSVFAYNGGFCCCKDVCDCSGDSCNVGSPCDRYEMCPSNYVPCYDTFCTYCSDSSDCKAIDSDGESIYTKGICHVMYCDVGTHKCEESSSLTDSCIGGYSVYERYPSTNPDTANQCEGETISCPSGYKCYDGACVEIGAREGEACDEQTPETTCVTGLQCCEQCNKCYETCPNSLCCDSDDDCPTEKPYCNLAKNVCQETEAPCPRSEYDSCDKAAEGEISCGGTLSGCLYKTDDKYYKVGEAAGKEVNVTLIHSGVGCEKNDLYIYDIPCVSPIGISSGRKQIDSWIGESDTDIIVKIDGDYYQSNKNCKWELKVKCKDVCPESNSKCTGPFDVIEAGVVDILEGCLYAHDSKFYSVHETANRKVEVKVTHYGGSSCEGNNDLIVYDTCSNVISRIENQKVESWVGKNLHNDIKIEIHSDSDNKNCLWKLEVSYVSEECIDICTAGDGTDCSPFKCIGGVCSNVCDVTCGAECDGTNPCDEGWFCNSTCQCAEGLGEATISIYQGPNIVGVPGLIEDDFYHCGLLNYRSSTKAGCMYDDIGYLVYYNPLGNNEGNCDSNFFSSDIMEEGFGYYLYAENEYEITFDIPLQVEVILYVGANLISVPVETSLDDIAAVCGDKTKIFTYYRSSTIPGCLYDDNGYFVYYDAGGSAYGDCGSRFKSDNLLKPFVGYYVYFNGKNGDEETTCTLRYENGELIK